jgi:thioredoxin 1
MAELVLTREIFDETVGKSPIPVLVDFWAPWCMPCKSIAPLLEEISEEFQGKLLVGKVDVDQENDLANRYNIVSIPTLMVFDKGNVVRQRFGAIPRKEIENLFLDLV